MVAAIFAGLLLLAMALQRPSLYIYVPTGRPWGAAFQWTSPDTNATDTISGKLLWSDGASVISLSIHICRIDAS